MARCCSFQQQRHCQAISSEALCHDANKDSWQDAAAYLHEQQQRTDQATNIEAYVMMQDALMAHSHHAISNEAGRDYANKDSWQHTAAYLHKQQQRSE